MRGSTDTRRRHIRDLVASSHVPDQATIRELLKTDGFDVTQATISRDLDAIGATRVRTDSGFEYRMVAAESDDASQRALFDAMDEFVRSTAITGNLIVLKVPPGAAQFVASRIDAAGVDGVLGSIAGDDTILVITSESDPAEAVSRRLEGMG